MNIFYKSPNEELLEKQKDCSTSVHKRNLQFLAMELYKILNGISPDLMKEAFSFNDVSVLNPEFLS